MAARLRDVGPDPQPHRIESPEVGARVKDPAFLDAFELTGSSLKRPTKGFDADHPCIEDLKRKDHIAVCMFDEEEATSPGFLDDFTDACRMASPYMEFLATAVGLPY